MNHPEQAELQAELQPCLDWQGSGLYQIVAGGDIRPADNLHTADLVIYDSELSFYMERGYTVAYPKLEESK